MWVGYLTAIELEEMQALFISPNITISVENDILFCNWVGYQDEQALRSAALVMHKLFIQYSCSKILNDNTEVVGPWNHSTAWASHEWFPSMMEAGLTKFAWIFPNDFFAQVSANKVIPTSPVIRSFTSREAAMKWLTA